MTELRTILAREAAKVPMYDVGPTVLRAARRRRQRRTAGIAVAVIAGLASTAGVFVTLRSDGPADVVVAADRPPTAQSLPWLPTTIDMTVPEPPPLPLERGVGEGVLLYRACQLPCPARLVTEDGNQYALPRVAQMPPAVPRVATLSPDGRWLSYPDAAGEYLLRDLTGTQTLPTGNRRAMGWSADSGWVGLADAGTEDGIEVIRPPASSPAPRPLPAGDARPLAGLTTTGTAVFGGSEAHADGDPVDLRLVDATGTGRTVPINGQSGAKEDLRSNLIRTVDDDTVIAQLLVETADAGGTSTVRTPGDLIHIDTASGEVLTRIRLPRPKSAIKIDGETATTTLPGGTFRTLAAALPDGILLKVIHNDAPAAIELLDLATGDRSTITTLKGEAVAVTVRGEP